MRKAPDLKIDSPCGFPVSQASGAQESVEEIHVAIEAMVEAIAWWLRGESSGFPRCEMDFAAIHSVGDVLLV